MKVSLFRWLLPTSAGISRRWCSQDITNPPQPPCPSLGSSTARLFKKTTTKKNSVFLPLSYSKVNLTAKRISWVPLCIIYQWNHPWVLACCYLRYLMIYESLDDCWVPGLRFSFWQIVAWFVGRGKTTAWVLIGETYQDDVAVTVHLVSGVFKDIIWSVTAQQGSKSKEQVAFFSPLIRHITIWKPSC